MENYLNLCSGAKWPLRLMPLKVYIGYYHLYETVDSSNVKLCQDTVNKAFQEWQKVTRNKISFSILKNGGNNLYSSQVNVIFRNSNGDIKGKTSLDINENKEIFGAEIEISLSASYINADKLYFVMRCEIGRCLGLANSDVPEDVTYFPYRFITKTPSHRDISTINALYGINAGIGQQRNNNVQSSSGRNMLDELDSMAEMRKNLFNINFKNNN